MREGALSGTPPLPSVTDRVIQKPISALNTRLSILFHQSQPSITTNSATDTARFSSINVEFDSLVERPAICSPQLIILSQNDNNPVSVFPVESEAAEIAGLIVPNSERVKTGTGVKPTSDSKKNLLSSCSIRMRKLGCEVNSHDGRTLCISKGVLRFEAIVDHCLKLEFKRTLGPPRVFQDLLARFYAMADTMQH